MQAWIETKKYRKRRRIGASFILLFCVFAAFLVGALQKKAAVSSKTTGFLSYAEVKMQETLYENALAYYMPILRAETPAERSLSQMFTDLVLHSFPVYTYAAQSSRVEATESAFEEELEKQLEEQLQEENAAWSVVEKEDDPSEQEISDQLSDEQFYTWMQGNDTAGAGAPEPTLFSYATKRAQQLDLEELKDYQTLVKQHYRINSTTSSNKDQLNLQKLLKKDMKLKEDVDGPQILIYHTHSLEGYRDSEEGKKSESVVAVGDYLTELLTSRYGYQVLHDRTTYDSDRDRAYSVAGPALQKILKDHPTIEVVIDLHRDGVGENTYLLTEVNDTVMAPVMFFNGLSYTNKNGALESLKNPNLQTNLAFSLQMELMASTYYPGFTRGIYLKDLRYNMHYCPKSLLVEVGAQTNSLREAMNAMPPLADVLNRVLSGEKP